MMRTVQNDANDSYLINSRFVNDHESVSSIFKHAKNWKGHKIDLHLIMCNFRSMLENLVDNKTSEV